MERYLIFVELLRRYNREENQEVKKEIEKDLDMLKNGLIPIKFIKY